MIRTCRDCELEFDSKAARHRKGFINQCGDCAEDVERTLGVLVTDGKSDYHVETLKNPHRRHVAFVKRQGGSTANTCGKSLSLGSYKENF